MLVGICLLDSDMVYCKLSRGMSRGRGMMANRSMMESRGTMAHDMSLTSRMGRTIHMGRMETHGMRMVSRGKSGTMARGKSGTTARGKSGMMARSMRGILARGTMKAHNRSLLECSTNQHNSRVDSCSSGHYKLREDRRVLVRARVCSWFHVLHPPAQGSSRHLLRGLQQ